MLLTSILEIFRFLFSKILEILPSDTLSQSVTDSISDISIYFVKANAILPIDTMITILISILTIEFSILLFQLANYILNKLRGAG